MTVLLLYGNLAIGGAMLLQFSVTNYRSVRETATLSMKASADTSMRSSVFSPDGKKNLLPVMTIYGANASGKTNVLRSLLLMREMVCGEYASPLKGEKLRYEPFSFSSESAPTSFDILYYHDGIRYSYGFTYDSERIISEYLYHWPNGREALVFSREGDSYRFQEDIQEQKTLAGRTPYNRLYLTVSNEWNSRETEKAFLWFRTKLRCEDGEETTLASIKKGNGDKDSVLREMATADLGIVDMNYENGTLYTTHRVGEHCYSLPFDMESAGTRKYFSHLGVWLEALQNGETILVDELCSSLHPLMTRHLINMFQSPDVNRTHAQLIFTTHDVGLLDLRLLRRDEIWFTEKDENTMETRLFALTDFSPRRGENIEKGYLLGRFGAVPFINDNGV